MTKDYLTIRQASKYLGVTVKTLYKYNMRGVIPYYRPDNKRVYYDRSDLEKYIRKGLQVKK